MSGVTDRWYLSGPLGVGTAFEEPTDAQSVPWAGVGTAVRHNGPDALNVLDGRPGAAGQGPSLNWWGLNAANKAVRLGAVAARFAAVGDGGAAGYLSIYTKPAGGDVAEALRIDDGGNVSLIARGFSTLTVGAGANGAIKVRHINGKHYQNDNNDGLYLNYGTGMPVQVGGGGTTSPLHVEGSLSVAGGRWNPTDTEGDFKIGDANYRLKVGVATGGGGAGDVRIRAHGGTNRLMLGSGTTDTLFVVGGNVGIGTLNPGSRLHIAGNAGLLNLEGTDHAYVQWYPRGQAAGRRAWTGFGGANTNSFDLRNDSPSEPNNPGRMHIFTNEHLYLLQKGAVIVGKEWGGTGNLVVQGLLGVNGQPASPRTPGWGGGIRTWDLEAEGSAWCRNGWQSGPRDLAENFQSDETLAPGEIVCFHPERDAVVRSAQPNDPLVCGIVSTAPGVLLNSDPDAAERDKLVPVALCGRVPCKVVDENGPIRRGDLLTSSSTPGHAMRAEAVWVDARQVYQSGTILGKALEALEGGAGVIEVFVTST